MTATHRDLEVDVADKRFREDLYYRINVVKICVPPLRERGTDILMLATHFLRKAARSREGEVEMRMPPPFAARLMAYEWPGNVRELENCIERAVALARFDHLSVEDLPENVRVHKPDRVTLEIEDSMEILTLDELSRRYILLYRRMEKYQRVSAEDGSERACLGN